MPVSAYTDSEDHQRRLRGFAAGLLDLRPFWPIAARLHRGWIKEQMDSEGAFGGDPWEPLSPDYAAWKARVKPGKPMLWFSGALRRAAFAPKRRMGPTWLELWITDPKALWHQTGTRGRRRAGILRRRQSGSGSGGGMPARPIIPDRFPPKATDQLRVAFEGYVDELAERWGLT